MRPPTLTLAELGSKRAWRDPAPPASRRPHVYAWDASARQQRCSRCQQLEGWPGARWAYTERVR